MLGWLKRNRGYNVCDCGERIEANQEMCQSCAKKSGKLAQGWLCKDKGHVFMVITFPTRPGMSKNPKFYKAQECPVCLSKNIEEQQMQRR